MQALAMDGNITDSFMILPDQMGLLNSFIVLLSIPLFQVGYAKLYLLQIFIFYGITI